MQSCSQHRQSGTTECLVAFADPVSILFRPFTQTRAVCKTRAGPQQLSVSRRTVRMESPSNEGQSDKGSSQEAVSWPPAEMTDEWAEAVMRLAKAVSSTSLESADVALQSADGDEDAALRLLMDENWSDIRRKREEAVARARAAGDANRVSAVKEAQLRRKATGSARDFFKGYVETEGRYVDAGYVDDSADTMGKIFGSFKKLFGGKSE